MFYDLETTSGNDLDNLKTISYFIMVYFNPELLLNPFLVYRDCKQTLSKLTSFDFLPSFFGKVSLDRIKLASDGAVDAVTSPMELQENCEKNIVFCCKEKSRMKGMQYYIHMKTTLIQLSNDISIIFQLKI